ncbi:hypothetical protein CsSME_00019906 [Camellia sinensis var. sinensis]
MTWIQCGSDVAHINAWDQTDQMSPDRDRDRDRVCLIKIVECRRVLKWTYAYGYYLPWHEHAKRQFFEYLQGEAEAGLERLHQCAEKDLQNYLNAEAPSNDFNDFRTKLAGLTRHKHGHKYGHQTTIIKSLKYRHSGDQLFQQQTHAIWICLCHDQAWWEQSQFDG